MQAVSDCGAALPAFFGCAAVGAGAPGVLVPEGSAPDERRNPSQIDYRDTGFSERVPRGEATDRRSDQQAANGARVGRKAGCGRKAAAGAVSGRRLANREGVL